MPAKKNNKEVLEGKAVSKKSATEKDFLQKGLDRLKHFDREGNIHKLVGIGLIIIGAIVLRDWIFGLICLSLGGMFLMGYFEKKGK